jgi:hypothetical protein
MRHLCPLDPDSMRPLRVGDGPSSAGPRFGGNAPVGVAPSQEGLVYLATLPWSETGELEASIFVRADDAFIFKGNKGKLHTSFAEIVVHAPAVRDESAHYASGLSAHPLVVGAVRAERIDPEQYVPGGEVGHKVGGRATHVRPRPQLQAEIDRLLSQGYVQFAQLDFPSHEGDGDVSGSWLFGDGGAHFYVKFDRDSLALQGMYWFYDF